MLLLMLSRFSRVRLCDPTDCSPPGSSVHRIPQVRTLERVAISSHSKFLDPLADTERSLNCATSKNQDQHDTSSKRSSVSGEGQGGLACCSPWGRKGPDMTERLNSNTGEE